MQILTFDESTNKYRLWKSSYGKVLNGKIVAKFTLNKVEDFVVTEYGITTDSIKSLCFIDLPEKTQLSLEQLHNYINVGSKGYAWFIDNLQIFDKPMELIEFKYECLKGEKNRCYGCDFYYFNQNESVGTEEECLCDCMPRLIRPPQSWGYAYKEE